MVHTLHRQVLLVLIRTLPKTPRLTRVFYLLSRGQIRTYTVNSPNFPHHSCCNPQRRTATRSPLTDLCQTPRSLLPRRSGLTLSFLSRNMHGKAILFSRCPLLPRLQIIHHSSALTLNDHRKSRFQLVINLHIHPYVGVRLQSGMWLRTRKRYRGNLSAE
jgi:hypothetical protein